MMFNREKYLEIKGRLDLNFRDDEKARDILDGLVDSGDYSAVERIVKDNTIFVFGCGSSLKGDVHRLKKIGLLSKAVLIAADGAVEALLEQNVVPNLCVTDLDGNLESLTEASKKGCIMVVHAHGDNIRLLKKVVPRLSNKLGTTQVQETRKIKNYGGFTDGDRSVYLAAHFQAKKIILFGMDFKEETEKMRIGKQLLQELTEKTSIPIINLTGKEINIKELEFEQ